MSSYISNRIPKSKARNKAMLSVINYLKLGKDYNVCCADIGAGRCEFINNLQVRTRYAIDSDSEFLKNVGPNVVAICGDWKKILEQNIKFDLIWSSNFLEHLTLEEAHIFLESMKTILKSEGKLILMLPNFRLAHEGGYFDDWDHKLILTDKSIESLLMYHGYEVEKIFRKFLPLTVNSRLSKLNFLIPIYLRSFIKPRAGQMLVIAKA